MVRLYSYILLKSINIQNFHNKSQIKLFYLSDIAKSVLIEYSLILLLIIALVK